MKNLQLDHRAHDVTLKKYPLCFLAHDIDSPLNVGGLFRIADALGVEKIYLTGSSLIPPNSKIRKTARSTEKHVPYCYDKDPLVIVGRLKQLGYKVVCLEITSESIDIKDFSICSDEKICLVIGSEDKGVNQMLLDNCDVTIHIPMLGVNSSMNVVSACSIASYEMISRFIDGKNLECDR